MSTVDVRIVWGLLLLMLLVVLYLYFNYPMAIGEIHWTSLTDEQITTLTQDWDGEYYTLDNRRVVYQESERQDMIDYITKKRCLS